MLTSESLQQARVLVAGDVMLDRYWFGDAERISPEAPVPVVKVAHCQERLGGAGNVAVNMAKLGAQVRLVSVVGDDEAAHTLRKLLAQDGIMESLITDASVPTTVKLRIMARQQQMLRCDFESASRTAALTQHPELSQWFDDAKVVVLSDYAKGALNPIEPFIEAARQRQQLVLVDPKGDNYERYRGATLLTPNRAELMAVVGRWHSEAQLIERAQNLRRHLELPYLLLTRSEEGMSLFSEDGIFNVPAQAREVFDVSGAGDTVIAVLATFLAAGADLHEAVTMANRAGGIVVGKVGTAPITLAELFDEHAA